MFILTPKFKKINAFNQLIKTLFEQGFFSVLNYFTNQFSKIFRKCVRKSVTIGGILIAKPFLSKP